MSKDGVGAAGAHPVAFHPSLLEAPMQHTDDRTRDRSSLTDWALVIALVLLVIATAAAAVL